MVRILETLRLAPAGSSKVHDMLIVAADSLVEGGQLGIFTPCFFFLARKPLDAAQPLYILAIPSCAPQPLSGRPFSIASLLV
eukprot:17895_5